VGLRGAARLSISEVSGGMARRIALARAIALDPELIMYDEPFTGLDLIALGVAAKLIRTLNDVTGATSLVVSHDMPSAWRSATRSTCWPAAAVWSRTARRRTDARIERPRGAPVHRRGEPDGPVRFTTRPRRWPKTSGLRP
jgi:phospholipid/cholesterol/gamma-HCH transport system ATP-binding protein